MICHNSLFFAWRKSTGLEQLLLCVLSFGTRELPRNPHLGRMVSTRGWPAGSPAAHYSSHSFPERQLDVVLFFFFHILVTSSQILKGLSYEDFPVALWSPSHNWGRERIKMLWNLPGQKIHASGQMIGEGLFPSAQKLSTLCQIFWGKNGKCPVSCWCITSPMNPRGGWPGKDPATKPLTLQYLLQKEHVAKTKLRLK